MKQEQQVKIEGGGSAAPGMEQTGDIPSTEVTPSASLTSQQSDADDVSAGLSAAGMFTVHIIVIMMGYLDVLTTSCTP